METSSLKVIVLKKQWWPICIRLSYLLFIPLIAIFAPFAARENTPEVSSSGGIGWKAHVSQNVGRYEPIVKKVPAKYAIEGYRVILSSYMQQESGGNGGDVIIKRKLRDAARRHYKPGCQYRSGS